jgi:hypothetical protein
MVGRGLKKANGPRMSSPRISVRLVAVDGLAFNVLTPPKAFHWPALYYHASALVKLSISSEARPAGPTCYLCWSLNPVNSCDSRLLALVGTVIVSSTAVEPYPNGPTSALGR